MPERADINLVAVGELAFNCFGNMARVTEIHCRKEDINGRLFVGYYVDFGPGSTISMSIKEGEIIRHAGIRLTSDEIRQAEIEMLASIIKR
jgi:hypothetical protein